MEGPRQGAEAAKMRSLNLAVPGRRNWLVRCGMVTAAWLVGVHPGHCAGAEPSIRRLRFIVALTNPTSQNLKRQQFWLYLPVSGSATQQLVATRVSATHNIHTDAFGHTLLEAYFDDFPALAQKMVSVMVEVAMGQQPQPFIDDGTWLAPERFIESDARDVMALAAALQRPDPWETARGIFDWVSTNLSYAGYLAEDYGALYALTNRRGDCTEYAYLVVALARACGISARMVGGYVVDHDAAPRAEDYHNWAEVFIDGIWRLLDAQKGNWLTPSDQYVAFRYYRATAHNPLGAAHRFKVEGELIAQFKR